MISSGRAIALAVVALASGFVGGAWFIGSGFGYTLIPVPTPPPSPAPARTRPKASKPAAPVIPAVGVPKPANFSGGWSGLGLRADRADLLPSPGCDWQIDPRPFRQAGPWLATDPDRALGAYVRVDPSKGGWLYVLTQSTRQGNASLDLRPVFFDEAGRRMVPLGRPIGSSKGSGGEFSMTEFSFEPDQRPDLAKLAYFGVERVVPEAARLLAEASQEEAEEEGIAILPDPAPGKPYRFDLVDADGKPVRSEDFRGKIVLVTITGPGGFSDLGLSMAKKLREADKAGQLAFIHISFDSTVAGAREHFAALGLDGTLVVIPNDPTTRRIWRDGARIDRLPKFFLLDREGALRFACQPFEMQDRVDALFGRPKRSPFGPARPGKPATKASGPPSPAPSPPPKATPKAR